MAEQSLKDVIYVAVFDPGLRAGMKGERSLTQWQTDSVMMALEASYQKGLSPVWVQNLIGFVEGRFPADDGWQSIFIEQLKLLAVQLADHRRRVDDLLEANNRYLQRARDADAALRANQVSATILASEALDVLTERRCFSPEVLAAHAEVGGDLEDMQRRFDSGGSKE